MGFVFNLLRKLPPIVWFGLAPVFAILAGVLWYNDNQHNAALAKQLSAAPPAAIALESFKPNADAEVQEVNLIGQMDVANLQELVTTKDGREVGTTTFVALYPASATDTAQPAPVLVQYDGKVTEAQIMKIVDQEKQGSFGPIVTLNGMTTTGNSDFTSKETELRGIVKLVEKPIFINPFFNGRQSGLKPSSFGGVALAIGLILAGLSLLFGWLRMRQVGGLRY